MKSPKELGEKLLAARQDKRRKLVDLVDKTGLTAVTLRRAFDGSADSRLSTVFALANELGLELALVPKGFGQSVEGQPGGARIQSRVERALGKRNGGAGAAELEDVFKREEKRRLEG